MDLNRDEIRRELRDADELNRAAVPGFLEAIRRLFDPSSGATARSKADLLGVPMPGRRSFLKVGGLTVLGGALIAACSSSNKSATSSGSSASTSAASSSAGANLDTTLAKTAASLEALAVATYDTAIKSGLVTTPAVADAAKLFMDHHQQHLDAINKGTGANYTAPNAAVKTAIVDPAVASAKTEADIGNLAYALEDAATQTYVYAASALSTPALRSTIMTIGGTEAKHKAILAQLLKKPNADLFGGASFAKKDNPLAAIPGALIG